MTGFDPREGQNPHEKVYAQALSAGLKNERYMFVDRPSQPQLFVTAAGGVQTAAAANAAEIDAMIFPDAFGNRFAHLYQTTAQTLLPVYNDKGLEVGLDAVDNDSLEIVFGGNTANNKLGYLAGTDPGVVMRLTLEIADTSVNDQMVVGYRKQEAFQVPVSFLTGGDALYTDFIGIGFSGTAAANVVNVISDIGNSGVTLVQSTGFAWADAGIHTLEVRIKGRKAEFFINGIRLGNPVAKDALAAAITSQPTVGPNSPYTVTSGLFMVPFFFNRRGAAAANANYIRKIEIGRMLEIGLDPASRNVAA